MTYEEVAVRAMARTSEVTDAYPATRSLMYPRIGYRQRVLMAEAARRNPDYYGTCAESALDESGATDLNDIIEPTPTPELIEKVTVEDPGTSDYEQGREIAIVPLADIDAELPPRMTLRDLVLQQVADDLAGVGSVMIFYSRLPAEATALDADSAVELQSPWDRLLEIDLCVYLLNKATRIDAAVRERAIAVQKAEEVELLAGYFAHIENYGPMRTRFGVDAQRGGASQ